MVSALLYLLLWLAWGTQAVLSAVQVRKYSRRFGKPAREEYERYRPPAVVIVPFKGVDTALEQNVQQLFEQDYPQYRLLFVVESEGDPAYPVLRDVIAARTDRRVDLLVAGLAAATQGQKTHNQIFAIEHIEKQNEGEEAWVFADSDAAPGPQWLGSLVGPLVQTQRTAVTTGYRWLVPEKDEHGRSSIWSRLGSVMNSSVACFMGRDEFTEAWGGSMAVRVETARRGDLIGTWRNALTDDFSISEMARRLGLRVYFVPHCLVAAPVDFTLGSLVNFGHRQYLLARVYVPRLYWSALGLLSLYVAGLVSAVFVLVKELLTRPEANVWLFPVMVMLVVAAAEQVRATLRRRVIRTAFGDEMLERLRTTLLLDRWATPVWMTLHWLIVVRAGIGRTMRWRGTLYKLRGPKDVERLSR